MTTVIADRVFISLRDGDTGGGGCQCQRFQQILNWRRASKDSLWHAENQRTFQTLGNNIYIECNILPWFTTYIKKLMSSLSLIWLNKSSLVKKQAIKNLPSLQQNMGKGTICCIYRLLVSFNTRLFWPKKVTHFSPCRIFRHWNLFLGWNWTKRFSSFY